MEPGGSHGLQNRSRPDFVGLGGFDSHALPPVVPNTSEANVSCHPERSEGSVNIFRTGIALICLLASDLTAQRVDSLVPPITPRRAFLLSFLAPGYSQSVLGRYKAASAFMLVEGLTLTMIRESAADLREARRFQNDTIILSYRDTVPQTKRPGRFGDPEVRSRRAHVEDWIALLVANHLFAGADAFVAAHLWDVEPRLAMRATPNGSMLALSLKVR
jgi:hypothetical protein